MAIGLTGDSHLLIDGQEAVEIKVSSIRDNTNAGVTQRVYADGVQRSISGFSTFSSFRLTIDEISDETYDWIRQRSGRPLIWRDDGDLIALVTIGNLNRSKSAKQPYDLAWGVTLDLFLVEADINQSLPTEADLEIIG